MKESDLFEPIKKFLIDKGCIEVYGEVAKTDVLGIYDEVNMIVELKKSLSFKLIDQAIERTKYGHFVYIAIPKRKSAIPKCVKEILELHKIGLIEIGKRSIREVIPATFNTLANKRKAYLRIRKQIKPYSSTQIGGVKSGDKVTDYSITLQNIKDYMYSQNGCWVTVDDILANCETHYKKPKESIRATLQEEWNKDWCETKIEKRKRYFRTKSE